MPRSTTAAPWNTILVRRLPCTSARRLHVVCRCQTPRRPTMAYDGYECLRVRVIRGVAFVTLDHPPINLFDLALMRDLARVSHEVEADAAVRVVILESANPEFFIAHADVRLIQSLP